MSIADAHLKRAELNFLAEIYEDAERNAYTAALNAARAAIFDKLTIAPKTHAGARTKFLELVNDGLDFDAGLANFLAEGFEKKQGIDYGPELTFASREEAEAYLARARAFLAAARAVCD
ncbi:MAG: HEPN domain-containing protein [Alphaproteobacteria bacterium]|nr:HEPN domain-containing protein [Alphaproteobacteria bacterium]